MTAMTAMTAMTVLYDPNCPLCVRARQWFLAQPTFFPVSFVPQGSVDASHRFPQLHVGQDQSVEDLIVVANDGRVYRNTRAWIMCFYALREYRPLAFRLSHPALMPLAHRAYQAVSSNRLWLSRYFGSRTQKITNQQLADRIKNHSVPIGRGCHPLVAVSETSSENACETSACAFDDFDENPINPHNLTAE